MLSPTRESSGRLSRAAERAVHAVSPAEAKRLRDAALRGMADPMWGTELGRLFLEGKLNEFHAEAGRRWHKLVLAYYRAIGAPMPWPKPLAFELIDPGRGTDMPVANAKAIIADMRDAHGILISAGKLAEQAVRALCEDDLLPVGSDGLRAAQHGLMSLARHWRLTELARRA